MLSTERILEIVAGETADCSDPVQAVRDELVREWKVWNEDQGAFCAYARQRIGELSKRMRGEARDRFRKIRDVINVDAVEGARREDTQRQSAARMKAEILGGYEVINRQGRGVVYLGSARFKAGTPVYEESRALGREVFQLLGSTSWTGAGPGIMQAPLEGAKEAGGRTAGIKIELDTDQTSFEQDINSALVPENVAVCKYFGPRKIGLADAAMRDREEDRTAIIVLPGGFGTLDEWFEYVVLKQLKKLGSRFPVPILLMNYEGFYDHIIAHLYETCVKTGTVSEHELQLFHICPGNFDALEILAATYNIPKEQCSFQDRIHPTHILHPHREQTESTAG